MIAMPFGAPILLPALLLEDSHFGTSPKRIHHAKNFGARDEGRTRGQLARVLTDEQDLVEDQPIGRVAVLSVDFDDRAGLDTMMREAELEELEKQWREQNDAIMREFPRIDDAGTSQTATTEAAPEAETASAVTDAEVDQA